MDSTKVGARRRKILVNGEITMDYQQLLNSINSDIYRKFKIAVELGRWSNGRPLTKEQRELTLQAIIAYENKHLPPEQRSGYMPPKPKPCNTDGIDKDVEQTLQWKEWNKE